MSEWNDDGVTSSDLSVNCQHTRSTSRIEVTFASSMNHDVNWMVNHETLKAYLLTNTITFQTSTKRLTAVNSLEIPDENEESWDTHGKTG